MRTLHIVGIVAITALVAVGATLLSTSVPASASPAAQDSEEPARVDEKLREKAAEKAAAPSKALIWVYPVQSIEKWEDSLPVGLPGRRDKLRLEEARELMLGTHFPYLKDGTDYRLTMVNFQKEYHRQLDLGATLVWTDGESALFSRENVSLSSEARVGRDD